MRGTRERRSCISRRARPSAKLSRKVPPEYINATTAAASASPKTSALDMDRAATTSSPTSPFQRLRTISTTRAARTGMTPPVQAIRARSGFPARYRPVPAASPSRAIIKRATSNLDAAFSLVSRSAGNSGMFDNFSARSKSEVAGRAGHRPSPRQEQNRVFACGRNRPSPKGRRRFE